MHNKLCCCLQKVSSIHVNNLIDECFESSDYFDLFEETFLSNLCSVACHESAFVRAMQES